MRRLGLLVVSMVGLIALAAVGSTIAGRLRPEGEAVPTAEVRRGRVDTTVHAEGELRAMHSEVLTAPPAGAQLRILTLKGTGETVAPGDVVVTFDPAEQEFRLEEQRSTLREAELEIAKLAAEADVQHARDEADLATARYDVRKAELDVQGREWLPAIDARKRELTLEESRRHLAQVAEDVRSHTESSEAALAVAQERRNKARLAIEDATQLLGQMTLRAGLAGIVTVRENRESNVYFTGMTFSEYRQGDTVRSGRPVVEIISLEGLELAAKVPESDQARISAGLAGTIDLDALPGDAFYVRVAHVGGISSGEGFFFTGPSPSRQVDVTFSIDRLPAMARPGFTGRVTVAAEPLDNVLYVPRQAVVERQGTPAVYVKVGDRFERREVRVVTRTRTVAVVEGLAEGTTVALNDPTRAQPGRERPATPVVAAVPAAGARP